MGIKKRDLFFDILINRGSKVQECDATDALEYYQSLILSISYKSLYNGNISSALYNIRKFETLANPFDKGSISANKLVFGKIKLTSDIHVCESCNDVMGQFQAMFPNIQISYINGSSTTINIAFPR